MNLCWLIPDDRGGGVVSVALSCVRRAQAAGHAATLLLFRPVSGWLEPDPGAGWTLDSLNQTPPDTDTAAPTPAVVADPPSGRSHPQRLRAGRCRHSLPARRRAPRVCRPRHGRPLLGGRPAARDRTGRRGGCFPCRRRLLPPPDAGAGQTLRRPQRFAVSPAAGPGVGKAAGPPVSLRRQSDQGRLRSAAAVETAGQGRIRRGIALVRTRGGRLRAPRARPAGGRGASTCTGGRCGRRSSPRRRAAGCS